MVFVRFGRPGPGVEILWRRVMSDAVVLGRKLSKEGSGEWEIAASGVTEEWRGERGYQECK